MEQVIDNVRPGVRFSASGEAEVLVWAPESKKVAISIPERELEIPLEKAWYGYWKTSTAEIRPGDRYWFRLDEGEPLPDPAALYQPEDVHGPSEAVNVAGFQWTDKTWKNPVLADYIIYELHVGTFTPEGTFHSAVGRLDYLSDLGITAIEIMPFSQFAGPRNWGYDGVFPYSVQNSYGGPTAFAELVDACHRRGIAVILDMVYNHMGPEGNIFSKYGPYFTDKYHTPWGDAINFDDAWSDAVRHFFIQNVLMWFRDFHVDALRLDAVHAIKDFGTKHVLQEMREHTDALQKHSGNTHYLMVEMDLNDPRFVKDMEAGGFGMDAQWIDEFHHALRVSSGQSKTGYYADFDPIESLAKSYRDAYVFDGQYSDHRKRKFGMSAKGLPGERFIVFSQNHDHVGNRMLGERTSQLVSFEMQKLLAGAVMVSPYVPLLFMGEEWSESNPFQYFVSHTDPELAEAVRQGRKREFAAFHIEGDAPDPMSEQTFQESKLQWSLLGEPSHRTMHSYYKEWIRLRKTQPALKPDRSSIYAEANTLKQTVLVRRMHEGQELMAVMNFSKSIQSVDFEGNWQKLISSSDLQWGGNHEQPEKLAGETMQASPESVTVFVNTKYS